MHVVTAGHCIDAIKCENMALVFNYYVTGHNPTDGFSYQTITAEDVYSCSKYVREHNKLRDYGYIELDRPVPASSGHVPVQKMEIDPNVRVSVGDDVVVIGFGSGLPMKIDTGGKVASNEPRFLPALDPDFSFKATFDS